MGRNRQSLCRPSKVKADRAQFAEIDLSNVYTIRRGRAYFRSEPRVVVLWSGRSVSSDKCLKKTRGTRVHVKNPSAVENRSEADPIGHFPSKQIRIRKRQQVCLWLALAGRHTRARAHARAHTHRV